MNSTAKYPKILVVSNNPFSSVTNNGKTLASFFASFPEENVSQLYFSPEVPDIGRSHKYFRISDIDMIKGLVSRKAVCGGVIRLGDFQKSEARSKKLSFSVINVFKKYDLFRILREMLWLSRKWKSELLNDWLEEISPEVIFFCAGDSGFAYDIVEYIRDKFNAKLVVYITDDYILPRKTVSPFWWIRRNYIFKKMKRAVGSSDLFITISQKMREVYRNIFGKDSIVAVNITDSLKDEAISKRNSGKNDLTLVYAGGLHYNRYKTLNLLAKALEKYNQEPGGRQKAFLHVYSYQLPSRKMMKYLNVPGASKFCGRLNPQELRKILNSCDIPVHVESFDKKSLESTKLSISTKIPEYMSLGKPILAIGPSQIASMEYLSDCAYCITNTKNIYSNLRTFLQDKELQEELASKALAKFNKNHDKERVARELTSAILSLFNEDNQQPRTGSKAF